MTDKDKLLKAPPERRAMMLPDADYQPREAERE